MFVKLVVALIAVLELKLEGQSASVFDTYPIKMAMFCVIFALHGILLLAEERVIQRNANYAGIVSKAILFSGSLVVVILFQVIFPALGCLLLVLWVVCFFKVVFELYVILLPAFQILQAITEFYGKIRRLIGTLDRQQDRPPVWDL